MVVGHDEGQIMNQMRRIFQKDAALLQRFHDQRNVALLQITHPAMHQLGRAAGSPFAEIRLFEQHHLIAPRGRVERNPHSGRATANNRQVPFHARLDDALDCG